MEKLSHLEARVAAATQTLAGRKDRVGELENYARRLEAEMHELTKDRDRLQDEVGEVRAELSRLGEQDQQFAGENKRLIGENSRYRGEIERLESEITGLREERGRLTRLLDALVDAVEKDTDIPPEALQDVASQAEVVEMVRPVPVNGTASHHAAEHQEDIPNEAARRLMDRIRDRIEAQRA